VVVEYGGTYYNNKYQLKSLVSLTHKNPIVKNMKLNQSLVDTVNKLSSNEYTVNKKLFKIITEKEYYKSNNLKLVQFKPHKDSRLISKYMEDKNFSKVHEIVSYNSNYLYDTSILNIAKLMLDVDKFYLTTFID
jgi:hypothetical protein